MSNEEIVDQIQHGIAVSINQERLWNNNKGYVIACVKRYIGACDNDDFGDYVNEGFIGLATAARKYKDGHGASFLTYATYHIRAALYRYNGANAYTVRIPEYLKERMRRLAEFKQKYMEEHHKEPESGEIQKALNISRRSLVHLEKTMLNMQTKSLDEYVSNDGDTKLIDLLSTNEGIDKLVELSEYQRELHGELEEALSILDEKTSMLIRCVYYQQMNLSQTAEIFSCSRQNVSERINKGFYKILHSEYGKRLEGFMWDGYKAKADRLSDYVDMDIIDDKGSEFLL